jgi:NAD(P)H-dependent FMN reductase
MMQASRPLFIPVILGTTRQGRMSAHAAQLLARELGKLPSVDTELIDIAELPLTTRDAGEPTKDADFSAKMNKADALVIVSPEYNHGYSGLLKHVLDSCLKEYIHKAVGIVGVSAGKLVYPVDAKDIEQVDPNLGGLVEEFHSCPKCGGGASRHS